MREPFEAGLERVLAGPGYYPGRSRRASARRRARSARPGRPRSRTRARRGAAATARRPAAAVEVALVVEQERLDAQLGAAVVRVHADRGRRALVARRARRRCRAPGRAGSARPARWRSGTRACRRAVAADDDAVDLDRPAEHRRGARPPRPRAAARGSASTTRPRRAAPCARPGRAAAAARGRPSRPRRSGSRRRRRRPPRRSRAGTLGEPPASSAASSCVNSTTSTSSMPASANSSSRRSRVASSSTRCPSATRGCGSNVTTVGVSPASTAARDDALVPDVHAVERADRDRARLRLELVRRRGRRSRRRSPEREPPRTAGRPSASSAPAAATQAASVSRLVDRERPDLRAPQRGAVPAERVRDRPHVRAELTCRSRRRSPSR